MTTPLRPLTADEIEAYRRDGAVCVRGVFGEPWLSRMADAVERVAAEPTPFGRAQNQPDNGFANDLFMWQSDDDFRDFVFESSAASYAQQILGSATVRFFYDQLFVKAVGSHVPTPWHQDLTFWPVDGDQICSIWMPFDPVTRASSGLEFVRGSHTWPNRYKAVTPDYNEYMLSSDLEDPPRVEDRREDFDLMGWDMEPGDALIFSALILHGSTGNYSTEHPRRALSTRWCGDDVVWAPARATVPIIWETGLDRGDPIGGPVFPQVLPEFIDAEVAARRSGPIAPDPEIVRRLTGS